MRSNLWKASLLFITLVFTACEAPKPSGDAKSEATAGTTPAVSGPVSGKTAFWEMYKTAHSWASDLVPLALNSKSVPGVKNEGGKAGEWTATFGSPSRREARAFTYSVVASPPDVYKGVTVGRSIPWSGPTPTALPFDTGDFAVDSEAAYNTAFALASTWAKAHPDKDVALSLGNASRFPAPVWYVLWGDSKSGYAVFVNAKSGAVVNQK